ncbi:MAG TPA: hypothetical protein VEC43_01490, partial [Candidatus Acidoferrales bacterium]|nr:hypothetical protein [Candidatus Acidoferrales bacterium]
MIQLRDNEAAVLKALQSSGGNSSFEELVTSSRQESAAATRALSTLQEKQLVHVREAELILLKLTPEGAEYAKLGLPERRLVQAVLELGGEATLEQASRRAGIQPAMASVALGWIKVTKWCEVTSQLQKVVLRARGIPDKTDAEKLLEILSAKSDISLDELPPNLRKEAETLRR